MHDNVMTTGQAARRNARCLMDLDLWRQGTGRLRYEDTEKTSFSSSHSVENLNMPNVVCSFCEGQFQCRSNICWTRKTNLAERNMNLKLFYHMLPEKTERQMKKHEYSHKESVHCAVVLRSECLKARPKHQLLHSRKLCISRKPHSVWHLLQLGTARDALPKGHRILSFLERNH